MKKLYLPLLALAIIASCSKEETIETNKEETTTAPEVDHSIVQGEAIVKFSDEMISLIESDLNEGKIVTRSMGLNQTLDEIGISSIKRLFPDAGEYEPRTRREGLHKWYIVSYKTDVPQTRASAELESVPGVEYVEGHRIVMTDEFNDPEYSKQWGYANTENEGYDINVLPVWDSYTTGNPKVIVAVVDQGVDLAHEDLAANCSSLNYNSINYNNTVVAGTHGTHVAGTIAAVNNNSVGVSGVAGGNAARGEKGVTIMSCEILREVIRNGKTQTIGGNSATAIKWAADHGAVICQNSWAYSYDRDGDGQLNASELANALAGKVSAADKSAIDYFIKYAGCDNDGNQLADSPMKGGLVVFAAGNENIQNGVPANYEPVIAVAAIDKNGKKASYSNYGDFVDIAAPGSSVYSTLPNGKYGYLSGTSMACPHVSGVAALLVSYLGGPGFTCDELKERILSSKRTDIVPGSIGGLIDAMGALTYGGDYIPEKAQNLSTAITSNELRLSWTVSGDADGHPAYGYSVFIGKDKAAVEAANTSGTTSGVTRTDVKTTARLGETTSVEINDLDFNTTYYAKVIGYSYARSYGEASDIISFVTEKNNPPVIELDVNEDITLKSHESARINVTIHDPDGHDFTYTYKAGSTADSFAKTLDGKLQVTINAPEADAGTYTAELTATDKYGESSTEQIKYTILENTPPQKLKDVEDMFITTVGTEFSLNMPDYFTDPDGESLKYSFSLSDPSVARLIQNEDKITGTILKYGVTTVTISAIDAKMATAKVEFKILARDAAVEYAAYPNPVADVLKVATGKDLVDVNVRIVSQTGSVVFDGDLKSSAFEPAEIDMSKCAPGKYSATIKFDSKEFKQTIVKK